MTGYFRNILYLNAFICQPSSSGRMSFFCAGDLYLSQGENGLAQIAGSSDWQPVELLRLESSFGNWRKIPALPREFLARGKEISGQVGLLGAKSLRLLTRYWRNGDSGNIGQPVRCRYLNRVSTEKPSLSRIWRRRRSASIWI